jgi:hypothetical protein
VPGVPGARDARWRARGTQALTALRRRWFVMKQGKIFWFKSDMVTPDSIPRGVIDVGPRRLGLRSLCPGCAQLRAPTEGARLARQACGKGPCLPNRLRPPAPQVNKCLSIKGAEDTINKPNAFEISTHTESMFFIADTDKARREGCRGVLPRGARRRRRPVPQASLALHAPDPAAV